MGTKHALYNVQTQMCTSHYHVTMCHYLTNDKKVIER